MKHIFTLIFIILLGIVTAFCQTEALLVNENFKDSPIETVFEVLKEKYNLQIAYNYEAVAGITIQQTIENLPLEKAIKVLFSTTVLDYQLKDQQLLVRRRSSKRLSAGPLTTMKKYAIRGEIIDDKTGQAIEFATIFSKVDNQGNATDEGGRFGMTVTTDKKAGELVVQHLAYVPRTIVWKANDDLSKLIIRLQAKSLDFEEITITEKIPTISTQKEAGAINLNAAQLNTLPSFVGGKDIMKSLQLLPGIGADDDLSSELRIRGGTGDENMVIMDGITLYKVDHYFGIFSAINSTMVDEVNVYKNAFPVEYGGRTSGVVEFKSKESTSTKLRAGVEVNLLTSNGYVELPIGNRMNVLLGGRMTNKNIADTDLFNVLEQSQSTPNPVRNTQNFTLGGNNSPPPPPSSNNISRNDLLAYAPDFKFNDFNIKWAWNITPRTRLAAHYFRGYDEFAYDYTQEFTVGAKGKRRTENIESYSETANWLNKGLSIKAKHEWTDQLTSNLNFSCSGYQEDRTINTTNTSVELRKKPLDSGKSRLIEGSEDTVSLSNQNHNEIKGTELNWKNVWTINKQQRLVFGYNMVANTTDFNLIQDNESVLRRNPSATQHALYGQYAVKTLADKLEVHLGLRSTYYSLTKKNYWSPRINLSYKVSDQLQLKAAWSRYNQFLRRNYFEDRFGRSHEFWVLANDKTFPVATATNWMGGFNFFHDFVEIDVEVYHKTTNGILEYTQLVLDTNRDRKDAKYAFLKGDRVSKGIDILLKKNIQKYTTWFSYTLSKTTNSFKAIDKGTPYPSRDDRRHQIKWVHQYAYKNFDFSATYAFSSGKPYTDLAKIEEEKDRRNTKPEDLLSYLEAYQRVDIGASYRFDWGKSKGMVGLSVFNLLNKKNVKYRQYVLSVTELEDDKPSGNKRPKNVVLGTELQMLKFTPNLSFSLSF